MQPDKFEQANRTLRKPESYHGEMGDLPVFTDGKICVSKWRMSFIDRLRALWFGTVWLMVWSGETQPPVSMVVDKSIFEIKESTHAGNNNGK